MRAAADLAKRAVEYLLGGPTVGGADEERLRRWFGLADADAGLPHARARYVVVATAVEGSGRRAPAVALAALGVERLQLDYAACFTASLRPHDAAKTAMLDFLEFLRKSPLLAFDAAVERARIDRAMKSLLGVPLRHPCIDLGSMLRASFPTAACASLDEWLAHWHVEVDVHDDALGRMLGCAELALIALDAAAHSGAANARALLDVG